MKTRILAAAFAAALPVGVTAQTQQVRPSTAMTLLSDGGGGARRGSESGPKPDAEPRQTERAPTPADKVQEGVKALRGILRF